jgi:prepilin-type N-terminal cleavage/methylation domain-containing protein
MKINKTTYRNRHAFTLIEMIGVLAVIAILAALLIPKVFEAINNARINSAAVSYNTVKAAVIDHYAKFGTIASINGVATGTNNLQNFDTVLLQEGFLDKPFATKISNANSVRVSAGLANDVDATADNAAYNLDGDDTVVANNAAGAHVVEALLLGVAPADAKELNDRLDGVDLGIGNADEDLLGRVKYGEPDGDGLVDVYIYVTHR